MCHVLERLGGVVVEIRRRVSDASQRQNLERVCVLKRWIVDDAFVEIVGDACDQRTSWIGTRETDFFGSALVENELPDRVPSGIELGHADAQEPLTRRNRSWRRNEELRELVGCVQQWSAVTV
jgi:hypothetical protein